MREPLGASLSYANISGSEPVFPTYMTSMEDMKFYSTPNSILDRVPVSLSADTFVTCAMVYILTLDV